MLNMIPMEVINKHDSLKNAFISGDILQAVKWEEEWLLHRSFILYYFLLIVMLINER